jgi:hypothetical protein
VAVDDADYAVGLDYARDVCRGSGRYPQEKTLLPVDRLRLKRYREGLSVQIMHIGSYDDEGPTLHKLHHEFMPQPDLHVLATDAAVRRLLLCPM